MKKVYIATLYGKTPVKVFANDEEEAKKAAFAAHTYNSAMWHPNPPVDEVVTKVELDPDQIMNSVLMQPAVQVDYKGPTAREVIAEQFSNKKEADA